MLLKVTKYIIFSIIRTFVFLRYKIEVKGFEELNSKNLKREGGILFLPNHPAEVDPIIVGSVLWKKFQPRPMIVEWIIKLPVVSIVMKMMRAIPIPDFDDKSSVKRREEAEQAFKSVVDGLRAQDNFMVYPAGRLKSSEKEVLGGASGVYKIIQAYPKANIVLVRTTGLWGSRFSRGWDGKKVVFLDAVIHSLKTLLKNGIFFVPKRRVCVELQVVNASFPFYGSRFEINAFLEEWYNQKRDPLTLVPYQFWSQAIKRKFIYQDPIISVQNVPASIQADIRQEISKITKCLHAEIKPELNLFSDLRLDSLDIQDLASLIEERYGVKKVKPCQLTTVASVMNYAANPDETNINTSEMVTCSSHWKASNQSEPIRAKIQGNTIPEAFFKIACQRKKEIACADLIASELSYERLMLGVILLSKKIQKIPGEYVGILLPASTTVNILILACQVAKKIPVMINWTVGKKHLQSVREQTDMQKVISSKKFLKNIEDTDLSPIEDIMLFAEDLKQEISFLDKLKAYFMIKLSYNQICKILAIQNLDKDKVAAQIFTSGTETMPKGVPLTHENIISNLNSAFDRVETYNHDVMLGFLPPFHSFGLTVTGILPLISGVRAIYYPNPTHYKKLAKLVAQWQVSFLCGAPTFIKGILQPAHREYYSSVRYVVTGAEKAPKSLIEKIEDICPKAEFLEGYGLSECGPILTLNVPKQTHQGVGPALDVVDLLIVNPDSMKPLPNGQKGHILAHGPNIFSGYTGSFPSPFVDIDGKRWFKTGDLGYLDARNYLTIVGRLKRQVKVGGEIINLNALEEALTQELIQEKIISSENEDQPNLAVCAKESDTRAQLVVVVTFDIKVDEINKKIKKLGFSNLHKVHEVLKLEKLPLMASGKIHYREIEEKF